MKITLNYYIIINKYFYAINVVKLHLWGWIRK